MKSFFSRLLAALMCVSLLVPQMAAAQVAIDPGARGTAARADARATAVAAAAPRIRIASPFGGVYAQSSVKTNGTTQVTATDRILFTMNGDYRNLSAVLINANSGSGSGALGGPGNAVKVHLALEFGGTTAPVPMPLPSLTGAVTSAGGNSEYIIGNKDIAVTRPVVTTGVLTAGSTRAIRFWKKVTSGEFWPLNYSTGMYNYISSGAGTTDPVNAGSGDSSDQSYQGSPTFGGVLNNSIFWAPTAFVGEQVNPFAVVEVTGDSIAGGFGAKSGRGYLVEGLEAAGIAYHNDGIISTTVSNSTNQMVGARFLAQYADYVAIHSGTNSLAASAWADLNAAKVAYLGLVQAYALGSNRILLATILPRPSTTDGCATYVNQTKPAYEALRIQINNWFRDPGPNGAVAYLNAGLKVGKVAGIIDPTVQLERNSDGSTVSLDSAGQQTAGTGGYFLPGYSSDCTHPNATGATAAAASVPVDKIKLPFVSYNIDLHRMPANDNARAAQAA